MFSYANATSLYVSAETGKWNNTGVSPVNDHIHNGPVPHINDALRIVAEMRRVGYRQPVSIKLMDGVTCLSSPVTIHSAGAAYHDPAQVYDITIESYGKEKKLISGGRKLTGFRPATFMGQACLCLEIPEVKEGKWTFTDLYVNGDRAAYTRYPEEGYLLPEDVEVHNPSLGAGSGWFVAKAGDLPENPESVKNAILSFGHYWIDEHTPIADYDPATRRVDLAYRTCCTVAPEAGASASMEYWLDNVPETFRHPGEFYLDKTAGMLYYIPRNETETAESIDVWAPVTDKLFVLEGDMDPAKKLRGIRFRNLRMAYTKGDYASRHTSKDKDGNEVVTYVASDGQSCCGMHGAINFSGCTECYVEGVDLFCCGTSGVVVGRGCDHVKVMHSSVTNGGGAGVRIAGGSAGEPEETLTHDVEVSDCVLADLGKRHFASDGVLIMNAYHCNITHNDIHGMYYSAVCVGWCWGYGPSVTRANFITKNHIYDIGRRRLSDMGGVYLLGGQPGTVVSGNVIHDVYSRHYGGWALYTDEGSSYITLENNVCYNVSNNCYHQHYGSMNTVRNNIFAYADCEAVRITRKEAHEGLLLENNIILCKEGKSVYGNATCAELTTNRNLIWCENGKEPLVYLDGDIKLSLAEVRKHFGWDEDSVVKNPRFRNPQAGDFTLRNDSPAFALGILPIDTSDVGPRA